MWLCCHSLHNIQIICIKHVRRHWRYSKLSQNASKIKYLMVLDFEATCEDKKKITQEIIEFPCLKVNASSMFVESVFHQYVKPVVNPQLSIFCTELTGILQEMVDTSNSFPCVLRDFEDWRNVNSITAENSVYVTSGDWDLGKMLPSQCELSGLEIPSHTQSWIDLKKLYSRVTGTLPKSLIEIIRKCGLKFQGRQHSGIDDSINIVNVLRRLNSNSYTPTSYLQKTASGFRVVDDPD